MEDEITLKSDSSHCIKLLFIDKYFTYFKSLSIKLDYSEVELKEKNNNWKDYLKELNVSNELFDYIYMFRMFIFYQYGKMLPGILNYIYNRIR